jgi:hypothetical protein
MKHFPLDDELVADFSTHDEDDDLIAFNIIQQRVDFPREARTQPRDWDARF